MLPQYQRAETEAEQEYQDTLHRPGEAEQQRLPANYYLSDDVLGYDDGRPGIGWGTFGLTWGLEGYMVRYLIFGVLAVIIMIVGQVLKHTAYGQAALQQPQPGIVQPQAGTPATGQLMTKP